MDYLTFNSDLLSVDSIYITDTLIALSLAFSMAVILRWIYIRFGTSISNRRAFSVNFFLLAMTVAFIISIVKSSLALSLGLVGALSIVRFRSAIKEPEELAYLFITIAIGIGLGAGQIFPTIAAFVMVLIAIVLHKIFGGAKVQQAATSNLSIAFNNPECLPELEKVLCLLKPHCLSYTLRRYIKQENMLDLGILVELKSETSIDTIRHQIEQLDHTAEIQFLTPQNLAL